MEQKRGGVPKRKRQEIPVDYNFIMPLFLKGKGFGEIAQLLAPDREYRVDYKTVYTDVQNVLKKWQAERMNMIDSQKELDLRKIDALEAVYWEAWEQSKKAKVKTVQKQRDLFVKSKKKDKDEEAKPVDDYMTRQSEKHVTEYVGDIQWLQGVERCIQARAEILQYRKTPQPGYDEVIPAARDVVFITRTRKNNDQFTEAIEIDNKDDGIQKLLST